MKSELDETFGGPWIVVVGKKFGGLVTYIPGINRVLKIQWNAFGLYRNRYVSDQIEL